MYLSGLAIVVVVVLVLWWVASSRREAAVTAATVAAETSVAGITKAMEPLLEVVVAYWIESERVKEALSKSGVSFDHDASLIRSARTSARRFLEATERPNAAASLEKKMSCGAILRVVLDSELSDADADEAVEEHEMVLKLPSPSRTPLARGVETARRDNESDDLEESDDELEEVDEALLDESDEKPEVTVDAILMVSDIDDDFLPSRLEALVAKCDDDDNAARPALLDAIGKYLDASDSKYRIAAAKESSPTALELFLEVIGVLEYETENEVRLARHLLLEAAVICAGMPSATTWIPDYDEREAAKKEARTRRGTPEEISVRIAATAKQMMRALSKRDRSPACAQAIAIYSRFDHGDWDDELLRLVEDTHPGIARWVVFFVAEERWPAVNGVLEELRKSPHPHLRSAASDWLGVMDAARERVLATARSNGQGFEHLKALADAAGWSTAPGASRVDRQIAHAVEAERWMQGGRLIEQDGRIFAKDP